MTLAVHPRKVESSTCHCDQKKPPRLETRVTGGNYGYGAVRVGRALVTDLGELVCARCLCLRFLSTV